MKAAKVFLISGATRGIGRSLADELAGRGHVVYGTGRSWEDVEPALTFHPIAMDV